MNNKFYKANAFNLSICQKPSRKNEDRFSCGTLPLGYKNFKEKTRQSILKSSIEVLEEKVKKKSLRGGSTLAQFNIFKINNKLTVDWANVGDSKLMVVFINSQNQVINVKSLNELHNLEDNPSERRRFKENELVRVDGDVWRIKNSNGRRTLAISRAIGDLPLKRSCQNFKAEPDILTETFDIPDGGDVILCAMSDGVYDWSNDFEEICKETINSIENKKEPETISKELINTAQGRSSDDLTVLCCSAKEMLSNSPVSFFVADGHSSDKVSEFTKKEYLKIQNSQIINNKNYNVTKESDFSEDQKTCINYIANLEKRKSEYNKPYLVSRFRFFCYEIVRFQFTKTEKMSAIRKVFALLSDPNSENTIQFTKTDIQALNQGNLRGKVLESFNKESREKIQKAMNNCPFGSRFQPFKANEGKRVSNSSFTNS